MPDMFIPLTGGLNLQEDPTQCPPGSLRDCMNYEVTQKEGYSLRKGWWYYDGTILGTELEDFLYIYYQAGWNSVAARYGEQIVLNLGGPTVNMICIGWGNLGSGKGVLVLANTIGGVSYTSMSQQSVQSVAGTLSGFALSTSQVIQQAGYYAPGGDPYTNGDGLSTNSYLTIQQNIIAAQQNPLAVPGAKTTACDAAFMLADNTYAIHDCIVFNFNSGTNASVNLKEGHVIKSVGGAITYGTVLSFVITSGDFSTADAAGYVVVYDVPLSTSFPANNTQMNVYTADGTTLIGNIFKYTSAGSLTAYNANSRALMYKTSDQTSGYTTTFAGWSRVPLSREIQYTQALSGQPTGIGFGPTGGAPFSIYEYSRNGLTNILSQLTPITSAYWPCQTATGTGWTNINNIKLDDGVFATLAIPFNAGGNRPGQYFTAQKFAFTDVPAGSAILGVQVEIHSKTTTANNTLVIPEVLLIKPDGTYANNKGTGVFVTTVNTYTTYGGATDLWGKGWTLTDLQNNSFGVFIRYTNISTTTNDTANVDFVGIQCTYLPPSRIVYIRNSLTGTPTDVPAFVVHYTTDNNTQFSSGNGVGTLTLYTTTTESAFTAAGKTRTVGSNEQIRDAPGGGGNLLGWTASTDTPISFPPAASLESNSSRWEWITYNFYADPAAQMAFGANGVEFGVGFDGTYTVRIRTGRRVDLDNPRHLFAYAGNLHLGYNSGDTIVTAPGRPLTVNGLQLSQVYNISQPVMGYANLAGQVLAVFGTRSVFGLQGTDPTNYTQVTLSPSLGAFEYTVVNVEGEALWTSFRGIETMQTTNAYGEFSTVPLSQSSTPLLQPRLQGDSRVAIINLRPVYALAVRNNRQYRLFFADGYTYSLTRFGPEGLPMGMFGRYNITGTNVVPRHVFQGIRTDGKEVLYACWDQINPQFSTRSGPPYVAKLDVGIWEGDSSHIPSGYIELNPIYPYQLNNKLTPMTDCQYQYATLFCSSLTGVVSGGSDSSIDVWTIAGDDVPVAGDANLNGNPNYSQVPTLATVSKMSLAPPLTQLYLPLPVVPSSCSITASGRMIRTRLETVVDFAGGPMRMTKLQITYTPQTRQGNY